MTAIAISGNYNWRYQSSYGATCQDKGGENWLLTPAYDLSKAATVTLAFEHAVNHANDMQSQQTLWVTDDFIDVENSQWRQLTIPNYPAGTNWTFVPATVTVPTSLVGKNTVFGFKYSVPADAANSTTWEIKNLSISVTCDETHTDILTPSAGQSAISKMLMDGRLYIVMPNGERYSVMGERIQ